ncbi:AAA family ATPase [Candidatus Fermentibacteria bacterium]|nr:AAA family ATPase [Candidatus Fermentibacteria bacterium]
MRLKRLLIAGFKSFADPLEMDFHEGITAIVGPNGCGKSNVADALRWVLGSQSARQLRVDRMEDVIFSGSATRKPMGMAEVTVTFENSDRALPLDFEEVAITRRVFRSGESEYLINGSRCRLMDVVDLTADSGLGSSGYWILEQPMVAALLSSKPEERRLLFDEAAGITKYKIQRHRAELKLEAAGADLARVDDIIAEVRKTADSLRRQAQILKRYEKASQALLEAESAHAWRQRTALEERARELEETLSRLAGEEQDAAAAVSAASAAAATARMEQERAQAELDRAVSKSGALDRQAADLDRRRALLEERIRSTAEQIDELGSRASGLEEKAASEAARAAEAGNRIRDLEESVERAREAWKSSAGLLDSSSAALAGARARLNEARDALREARLETGRRRDDLQKARDVAARASERRIDLSGQAAQLEGQIQTLVPAVAAAESRLASLGAALKEAMALLDSATREDASASFDVSQAAGAREAAAARVEEIASRLEGLRAAAGRDPDLSLSSLLRMREGYTTAAAAFLEGFHEASLASADSLDGGGGACRALPRGRSRLDVPPGGERLSDALSGGPPWAGEILSHGFVDTDRATALGWYLGGFEGAIVTREGDLFRPEGLVRLGMREEGGLALKAMAEEAAARLERERAALALCDGHLEAARARASAARAALDGIASRVSALERESAAAEAVLKSHTGTLASAREALAGLEAELASAGTVDCSAEQAATAALAEATASETVLAGRLEDLEREVDEAVRGHASLVAAEGAASAELRIAEMHLQKAVEEMQSAASAAEADRAEADRLAARASGLSADLEARKAESASLAAAHDALVEQCDAASLERIAATKARMDRQEESSAADSALASAREALSRAREAKADVSARIESLRSRIREEASSDIQAPPEGSRYSAMDDEELEREIEMLRSERDRLGPVNMLAGREYEEVTGRLEFLTVQRDDLSKAKQSLLEAISEINVTAASRFSETFESVRVHFRELFAKLFDGGEADIVPVAGEDPLESGVQIRARPAGKRLETLSVMSGGEKAMSSIALLFALYLVKPAPFCLLDELDGPLDDANVDRFLELLSGFAGTTQFVVVTHNRRTMEAADRLYGITMAEKGVSTLASVSLEDVEKGS